MSIKPVWISNKKERERKKTGMLAIHQGIANDWEACG